MSEKVSHLNYPISHILLGCRLHFESTFVSNLAQRTLILLAPWDVLKELYTKQKTTTKKDRSEEGKSLCISGSKGMDGLWRS